jgi:hypothetical protein
MFVKAVGKKHGRAEVYRASPKCSEKLALDTDVFNVLGVLGSFDRSNFFCELNAHDTALLRIEMYAEGFIQEVAGLAVPLLTFALVGRELESVPIGTLEGFVNVKDRLDGIVTWKKLVEADKRVAKGSGIDDRSSARLPAVHVEAEELCAEGFFLAKLEARLGGRVRRDAEKNVAIERLAAE